MTDDNPYKTAGAVEAIPPRTEAPHDSSRGSYRPSDRPPILSPQQIRRLATDRERLLWAAILMAAALGAMYMSFRIRIPASFGFDLRAFQSMLMMTLYLLNLPAAIFAYRVKAPISPSWLATVLFSALVLVPGFVLLVCLLLFQESQTVLEKHGIPATVWGVDRTALPGKDAI